MPNLGNAQEYRRRIALEIFPILATAGGHITVTPSDYYIIREKGQKISGDVFFVAHHPAYPEK